jgi:hypothetical protein
MTRDEVPFPPRDAWDVAAYDTDEVVAGYRGHRADDDVPGPNHSPGYRWGWHNRRKDGTHLPDGFEDVRRAYIEMTDRPN